jgi:hypothetical protein
MEQAVTVNVAPASRRRAYEKYGWVLLSASALLGIVAALITTLPPIAWF